MTYAFNLSPQVFLCYVLLPIFLKYLQYLQLLYSMGRLLSFVSMIFILFELFGIFYSFLLQFLHYFFFISILVIEIGYKNEIVKKLSMKRIKYSSLKSEAVEHNINIPIKLSPNIYQHVKSKIHQSLLKLLEFTRLNMLIKKIKKIVTKA